jgi:cold shock CspA family protein
MGGTSTEGDEATTHMEKPANLNHATSPLAPAMVRGAIRQLTHLSSGTDITTTRLVSTHNGVGYGYIGTPEGDVFFDSSAVTNLRFDQLARNMPVEFVLDQAPYRRASSVTVISDRHEPNANDKRNVLLSGRP